MHSTRKSSIFLTKLIWFSSLHILLMKEFWKIGGKRYIGTWDFKRKSLSDLGVWKFWTRWQKWWMKAVFLKTVKKKKKGSPFLLSTPTYQRPILRESSFLHVVTESLLYRKLPLSKREKLESRSDILPATSLVAFSSLWWIHCSYGNSNFLSWVSFRNVLTYVLHMDLSTNEPRNNFFFLAVFKYVLLKL